METGIEKGINSYNNCNLTRHELFTPKALLIFTRGNTMNIYQYIM